MVDNLTIEKVADAFVLDVFLHAGDQDLFYIFGDALLHSLIGIELIVLGTDNYGVYALRNTLVTVFYGYLTLGVRTKIGHYLSFLADSS